MNDMGYHESRLYGMDISRKTVASALITTPYNIFYGDIQKPLLIKDGMFDLILCMHTLEHTYDTKSAIKNIRLLLNHKGQGIFVVPKEPEKTSRFHATPFHYIYDFTELLSSEFNVVDSFVWSDVSPIEFLALVR
jgi:2-polyprenyl-3-methyl-5-hydroxy-6-metoxy-1,4-benzoquinol methylase